jgi:predicted ATP-dependent endonuclease of OLD family
LAFLHHLYITERLRRSVSEIRGQGADSVFLQSLTNKNYRWLEDVRLNRLDRFNVLIGRNNSGKSSVFSALQFLYDGLTSSVSDSERVLTDLDPSRSLEVMLTFEPSDEGVDDVNNCEDLC